MGRGVTVDVLVVANPVWETALEVESIPGSPEAAAAALREIGRRQVSDGGGSALNSACALACAGWTVVAYGRVGDDPEGRAAIEALRRRGIRTRVEVAQGRATKCNRIYTEVGTGANAFEALIPTSCASPWDGTPEELFRARIMLFDRLSVRAPAWMSERKSRDAGWNALNRNTPGKDGLLDARLRAVLPFLDYLQLPERTGPPRLESFDRIHRPIGFPALSEGEARDLLERGVESLVLTRGAEGAVLRVRGQDPLVVEAVPVTVVDPTGAGDAFVAGFVDRLLAGATPVECMNRGAAWAARACRHLGARRWLDLEPPDRI